MIGYLLVVEHESWAFCFGEAWAFAVNFAVSGLFVVYIGVLSLGPLRICRGMLLGSLIMAVLYHGSLVLARHEVARLFERFGGFRFVRLYWQ